MFHDIMHKEIEVYVDDLIATSRGKENHAENLRKLFERLRKFQLKFNPTKCTFGVTFEKLLGFVVTKRGIEVDPSSNSKYATTPYSKRGSRFLRQIELHLSFYLADDGEM